MHNPYDTYSDEELIRYTMNECPQETLAASLARRLEREITHQVADERLHDLLLDLRTLLDEGIEDVAGGVQSVIAEYEAVA